MLGAPPPHRQKKAAMDHLKEPIATILAKFYAIKTPQPPEDRLAALREQYNRCTQCPLATQGRTRVVFGAGPATATLMIIGEAPGRDEDSQGAPFVGRSGKLLTSMLASAGIDRSTIYISNVAKCRPPENRPPTPEESTTCMSHLLLKEIAIIKPDVICTLGATATSIFFDIKKGVSSKRGQFTQTEYFMIMPTYHPSYILRSRSSAATVIDDFLKIRAFLEAKAKI